MDKRNKISINFNKNYNELYNYLMKKPNISAFVCQVLQDHMEEEKNAETLDQKIERILLKKLSENKSQIGSQFPTSRGISVSQEDKELMKNLF